VSPCGVQTTVCELLVTCICYACALQACPGSLQPASMSRLLALRKHVQAPELVLVATYNSSVDNLTCYVGQLLVLHKLVPSVPTYPSQPNAPDVDSFCLP